VVNFWIAVTNVQLYHIWTLILVTAISHNITWKRKGSQGFLQHDWVILTASGEFGLGNLHVWAGYWHNHPSWESICPLFICAKSNYEIFSQAAMGYRIMGQLEPRWYLVLTSRSLMKQRLKVASCNSQCDTPYLGLYVYFDVTTYANHMVGEF
jgi:hypothetical protein